MNKSESIVKLAAALCAFQSEVENVKKDATNPFFKSKYATLDSIWDEVRPLLKKHKLALSQFPSGDGELTSILLHESGEYIEYSAKMSIKEQTPQSQGSSISYMRRYAMSSILGIVTEEDDDGNAASKPNNQAYVAPAGDKTCPECGKSHTGKYLKCLECWKMSVNA